MSNFYQASDGYLYCKKCDELAGECTCPTYGELEAAKDEEANRKRDKEMGL